MDGLEPSQSQVGHGQLSPAGGTAPVTEGVQLLEVPDGEAGLAADQPPNPLLERPVDRGRRGAWTAALSPLARDGPRVGEVWSRQPR